METVIGYWQISIKRIWPTNNQLAEIYDRAAPGWHRRIQRLGCSRAYLNLFHDLKQDGVLDHLQDRSPVLDCGVGNAAFSLALARTVPCKLKILGLDLSDAMVLKAHSFLSSAGVSAQGHRGDVRALPFAADTFDLVMSAHMLEHMPDPAVGLQEMVRVLRPGAPLLLSVTRAGFLGAMLQLRYGNGRFKPEVLAGMLAEAGLVNIRFNQFNSGWLKWISFACLGLKE